MPARSFPEGERKVLAEHGDALPDGSYPIPDCDALERAVEAYGRESEEKRPELRRLIARRHVELGCDTALPESWRIHG